MHTEETRDGEESKQPFTEFLGSATLKGIILKLYYRDRALVSNTDIILSQFVYFVISDVSRCLNVEQRGEARVYVI